MKNSVDRFLEPSNRMFGMALAEVKNGKKQSHWMWYIFPQLKGIGKTTTSYYYGISSLEEARDFLKHPILGSRLYEITQALLEVKGKTAFEIFGTPDYLKLKSCMTLFKLAAPQESVFQEVINTYYMGYDDELTRMKLNL
ncbi:DUF1810 domain-containing protein [Psychroflexus torquis]|nr:DUF1810 domain-containing protein [Psychroflexus torquis]